MKPPIPLHDPRFVYVPAVKTDLRVTFAKARAEMAKAKPVANVRKLRNDR